MGAEIGPGNALITWRNRGVTWDYIPVDKVDPGALILGGLSALRGLASREGAD